jgi:hypothetical protein
MTLVRTRGYQDQATKAEPETAVAAPTDNDNSPHTPEGDGELVANDIRTLLERVAGTSAREIDGAIAELHLLRQTLQSDSERIRNEITAYASLSQSTMQSTKIIAESLAKCRIERTPSMADPQVTLSPEERVRIITGLRPNGGAPSHD